mgnify:CR=1 FL=1
MKSFVIFAIVVTIIYVIYYTVIIVQDLYGKPKDEKSQGESFDVSDMTDEEESIAVSESDGGFSVGDNQYETAYEEKQLAEPTEEAAATAEESKPHVLEKIQSAIEKKMEEVNTTYSDPMYSEELNNTIFVTMDVTWSRWNHSIMRYDVKNKKCISIIICRFNPSSGQC